MFSDVAPSPQSPTQAIVGELLAALSGQPGIRLAQATGRRVFCGGGVAPQRFTRPESAVNDDMNVRAGIIQMNRNRTIARAKGRIEDELAATPGGVE